MDGLPSRPLPRSDAQTVGPRVSAVWWLGGCRSALLWKQPQNSTKCGGRKTLRLFPSYEAVILSVNYTMKMKVISCACRLATDQQCMFVFVDPEYRHIIGVLH